MTRFMPPAAASLAALAAAAYLFAVLPSGAEVNLVSGVWLALARDLHGGVFYRAVHGDGLYGGTRYFPLLFVAIAALMRAGLSIMRAGQAAGLLGGASIAAGVFLFVRGAALPRRDAWIAVVLALAPYLVLQTMTEIRAEPLAAGMAWLGAAILQRSSSPARTRQLAAAALFFALATAAKPTAAYAGVAGAGALLLARRTAEAWRLLALTAAGWAALALVLAGYGHGLENLRACAFAGGSPFDVAGPAAFSALRTLAVSHLVTVTVGSALAGLAFGRAWRSLACLMLAGAIASSIAVLATPGTIFTSQAFEPYIAAVAALFASGLATRRRSGALIVAILLVWAAIQDVREVRALRDNPRSAPAEAAPRAIDGCSGPVLAESPLVPTLANRTVVLLDPFGFRIASRQDPRLGSDLVARVHRREYACIVLGQDPATPRGGGWYRNLALGEPLVQAILAEYRLRGMSDGYRTYVPAR